MSADRLPKKDYIGALQAYLQAKYPGIKRVGDERDQLLRFPSGSLLHVKGSRDSSGRFSITKSSFERLNTINPSLFYALVFDQPNRTFFIPMNKMKEIFEPVDPGEDQDWHFRIIERSGQPGIVDQYYLRPDNDSRWDDPDNFSIFSLEPFLNNCKPLANAETPISSDKFNVNEKNLTYVQLTDFIQNRMDMHANYQPVVIKTIIENQGRASREKIEQQLLHYNEGSTSRSMVDTVISVLKENKILQKVDDKYRLNIDRNLTDQEIASVVALCDERIREFAEQEEDHDFAPSRNPGDSFNEIASEFKEWLSTDLGRQHFERIEKEKVEVKSIMDSLASLDRASDTFTNMVIDRLLPHFKTTNPRKRISAFPAYWDVRGIKRLKYTEEDWNKVANLIFDLVSNFQKSPENLGKFIEEFVSNKFHKYFQSPGISPILFCINDSYLLINKRIKVAYQDFGKQFGLQGTISGQLRDYIDDAKKVMALMNSLAIPGVDNPTIFDEFCYWYDHFYKGSTESPSAESEKEITVFVTGYSNANLRHSINSEILGWRNQSSILSEGDFIYVYDKDSHRIEACFRAIAVSDSDLPIWEEEKNADPPRIEFPFRWDVELIRDELHIDLNTIASFEPFSGQPTQKFIPLVGNNFPTPLTDDKYRRFRQFLLAESSKGEEADMEPLETRYWKIAPGQEGSMWEEQLANGVAAVGWNELGDLSNRNVNLVLDDIKKKWPDSAVAVAPQFKDFLSIRTGDIIIANKGYSKVIGIGRVVGGYKYRPDLTFHHTYPVEWFDTNEREIPPQTGIWRKTVSRVSPQLYSLIIGERKKSYLLFRHQPAFKRKQGEREYWNDLLGKEYHFGKSVVNFRKVQPGAKTIWFYTDKDKLYVWGQGEVEEVKSLPNDEFVATYVTFEFFNKDSGIEASPSVQNKVKSLTGWNPYNSIIEITEEIFDEIVTEAPEGQDILGNDDTLPQPTEEQVKNAVEEIRKVLFIDETIVRQIVSNLVSGKNILLGGPVGTGKTNVAMLIPQLVWKTFDGGYYGEVVTATADWTTNDVIGGIYPKLDANKSVTYNVQKGCVSSSVSSNWVNGSNGLRKKYEKDGTMYRGVWLVIDEFNRANIDRAFGEMITAIEYGTLKIPTIKEGKNYEELRIPKDYRIIATLNTFDKHYLFKLSDALKRRFAYIEVLPPIRREAEQEKYYVIKRSLENLTPLPPLARKIVLDDPNHVIEKDKTDPAFLDVLESAHDMFSFIRLTKNLGTAVLISMFRFILVDSSLNSNMGNSLDNAMRSNIIPQLESVSKPALEVIRAVCCDQVSTFLRQQDPRQVTIKAYEEEFRKLLVFLGRDNTSTKLDRYKRGEIKEDGEWGGYDPWTTKKKPSLPLFRRSLTELIEETQLL